MEAYDLETRQIYPEEKERQLIGNKDPVNEQDNEVVWIHLKQETNSLMDSAASSATPTEVL